MASQIAAAFGSASTSEYVVPSCSRRCTSPLPTIGLPCRCAHRSAKTLKFTVRREHRIPLDGVEQLRVLRQATAQRAAGWKERMRRDDEPPFALLQTRRAPSNESTDSAARL